MYHIHIQYAAEQSAAPDESLIRHWAEQALAGNVEETEVTIRIVEVDEMTALNEKYRNKTGPTNVLSFPADIPPSLEHEFSILGDIVICADVVNKEAVAQHKKAESHWAHMVVHGIYHLLGYDHEKDDEAEVMESLEIRTLQKMGFENPYEDGEHIKNHDWPQANRR